MNQLKYEVPNDIMSKDEKVFVRIPKRTLTRVIVLSPLLIGIFMYFKSMDMLLLGLGFVVLICLITLGLTGVKIPAAANLTGGGLYIDIFIKKFLLRKINKCIYIRSLDRGVKKNE